MKRAAAVLMLALLLLLPVSAAEEICDVWVSSRVPAVGLDFVYSVGDSVTEPTALKVNSLRPEAKLFAHYDPKKDRLYISMASSGAIDLTTPVAQIVGASEKDLKLETLKINGKRVNENPTVRKLEAVTEEDHIRVAFEIADNLAETGKFDYKAAAAAYTEQGQFVSFQSKGCTAVDGRFCGEILLSTEAEADYVTLFILNKAGTVPLLPSADRKITFAP